MLQMKTQQKNAIALILITAAVLVLFSPLIFNLNSTYFSGGGDGLKAYYGAVYHNYYDKNYHRLEGMNHPYGENIFFTGSQPPISNTVKFIDQNIFPCSKYVVGIINAMMIASVILGIFFIYLIFRRFRISAWYSLLVAIGIGFLSPQISRLGGHFSLGWMVWIPLQLYLLLLIQEKRTWKRSLLFGLSALFACMMHLYFFIFTGFLVLFYWANRFISKKDNLKSVFPYLHIFIQLLIPFLLIHLLMGQFDAVVDRTNVPWGFFENRAYPGSVFLPILEFYPYSMSEFEFTDKYLWEGVSYVGIIAGVGFIAIVLSKLIAKRSKRSFSDNPKTEVWFWASLAALLFSMGVPFIFGLENLRLSFGPIAQIRAVGRFAWLFYYVLNIIVFIKIYRLFSTRKIHPGIKASILGVIMAVLFFEAYYNTRVVNRFNNQVPSFTEAIDRAGKSNDLPFDKGEYQAIMPLPYFHVGSESIWISPKCGSEQKIFTLSAATGLPTNAVMMSRTSLSQTYKNVALILTPWKRYEVLDDYTSEKPILLVVDTCDQLNANEKRLIRHASFVGVDGDSKYYSLKIDSLKSIPEKYQFPARYNAVMDSIHSLSEAGLAAINRPTYSADILKIKAPQNYELIFEDEIKLKPEKPVFVRFWIKDVDSDLVARTGLLVIQARANGESIEERYTPVFANIRTVDGEWALVEIELQPQVEFQRFKLLIENKTIREEYLEFSEFTISQIRL